MRRLLVTVGLATAALLAVASPASAEPNPTPNVARTAGTTVYFEAGLSRVNQVTVTYVSDTQLMLTDTGGITPGAGCVRGATTRDVVCKVTAGINYPLDITLGTKNDTITFVGNLWRPLTTVDAGAGNDVVDFGTLTSKNGTAYGGPGTDILGAPSTSNTVLWLDGQDGADTICGGARTYASYLTKTAAVTVTMDDVANDGTPGEGDNVCSTILGIFGSPFADVLTSGPYGHDINGFGGGDLLNGGIGEDRLDGGDGGDIAHGGPGDDVLVGGAGTDWLDGGDGTNDTCLNDASDIETGCEV